MGMEAAAESRQERIHPPDVPAVAARTSDVRAHADWMRRRRWKATAAETTMQRAKGRIGMAV